MLCTSFPHSCPMGCRCVSWHRATIVETEEEIYAEGTGSKYKDVESMISVLDYCLPLPCRRENSSFPLSCLCLNQVHIHPLTYFTFPDKNE